MKPTFWLRPEKAFEMMLLTISEVRGTRRNTCYHVDDDVDGDDVGAVPGVHQDGAKHSAGGSSDHA